MEINSLELTLDYMISLKMQIEFENNINTGESIVSVIKDIYNFLKSMNKNDTEIIGAIHLLYDNIDPGQKENVSYILSRITNNTDTTHQSLFNFLNIMTDQNNQLNNQTDIYTNEFINPTDIANMFQQNLNNLHMNLLLPSRNRMVTINFNTQLDPNDDTTQDTTTNTTTQDTTQNTTTQNTTTQDTITQDDELSDIGEDGDELSTSNMIVNTLSYNILNNYIFNNINFPVRYQITYRYPNDEIPITTQEQIKDTTTEEVLNKNTIIQEYNQLSIEDKEKYQTCTFCLDNYKLESIIRRLKCSHIFHKDCVDPWLLKENYKCPICRDESLHNT